MKKKILCGTLAALMLLGVCPTSAFADDTTLTLTKSIDLRNQKEDISSEGWEWDADSQILTLEDFHATVPSGKLEEKSAIYLPDDSTLYLDGENELEVNAYRCDAIYAEGELYVSGRGTLDITTKSYSSRAFYVKRGPLVFDEKVEVNIDPAGYVIYLDDVRGQKPALSVLDDAKVTFPQDCTDRNIVLVKKSSVQVYDNWLNYSEELDDFDETVVLVEKVVKKEEPAEVVPEEPETKLNEYQITIGSPAIVKNGEVAYTADVTPYLKNGYTMLPLRALLEVSNPEQDVKWNSTKKMAYTFVNSEYITITAGADSYTRATENIALRTPAETVNGRLFVSLRDWLDIMGIADGQYDWNPETKTITLTY